MMKLSDAAPILSLCSLLALPIDTVLAQDALTVRVSPSAVDLPPGATTNTALFRAEALRSDAVTIEAGRLALARSKDPQVRDQAQRAISNRTATTDALLPAGTIRGEHALPAVEDGARIALEPADRALITSLRTAPDEASFNRAYTAQQARRDERTLALYDGFYRNGDTAEARRFAYEALPWIESERARSFALSELFSG